MRRHIGAGLLGLALLGLACAALPCRVAEPLLSSSELLELAQVRRWRPTGDGPAGHMRARVRLPGRCPMPTPPAQTRTLLPSAGCARAGLYRLVQAARPQV